MWKKTFPTLTKMYILHTFWFHEKYSRIFSSSFLFHCAFHICLNLAQQASGYKFNNIILIKKSRLCLKLVTVILTALFKSYIRIKSYSCKYFEQQHSHYIVYNCSHYIQLNLNGFLTIFNLLLVFKQIWVFLLSIQFFWH